VLVIASGVNRVNEKLVEANPDEPLRKANADCVHEQNGFVIRGVPSVEHAHPITTFVDRDLLDYAAIWAAAGTPNWVFRRIV
jgi:prolyl-tRNA editing enzyme YbaK/EbsC (Cys-tRNA(Pro) deacylase)